MMIPNTGDDTNNTYKNEVRYASRQQGGLKRGGWRMWTPTLHAEHGEDEDEQEEEQGEVGDVVDTLCHRG
jgi:hypothetical protein